jgi:hypothetical protein
MALDFFVNIRFDPGNLPRHEQVTVYGNCDPVRIVFVFLECNPHQVGYPFRHTAPRLFTHH